MLETPIKSLWQWFQIYSNQIVCTIWFFAEASEGTDTDKSRFIQGADDNQQAVLYSGGRSPPGQRLLETPAIPAPLEAWVGKQFLIFF
jgi:hypothetical protein